jgi:hypothetical protein
MQMGPAGPGGRAGPTVTGPDSGPARGPPTPKHAASFPAGHWHAASGLWPAARFRIPLPHAPRWLEPGAWGGGGT